MKLRGFDARFYSDDALKKLQAVNDIRDIIFPYFDAGREFDDCFRDIILNAEVGKVYVFQCNQVLMVINKDDNLNSVWTSYNQANKKVMDFIALNSALKR